MICQRIVLFPGLGANARMYDGISAQISNIVVPPWLPVLNEDLSRYAQRYVDLGLVLPGDVIGGCSFGGALAQEIAALLPVKKVLLIGSCRSSRGISPALRQLAPIAPWLPITPQHARLAQWPIALKFGATQSQHRRVLHDMINKAEPRLIRWAIHALIHWRGCPPLTAPLAHVHGSRDQLMPATRSGADFIVPGAGHFIAVTHVKIVIAWMRQQLSIND